MRGNKQPKKSGISRLGCGDLNIYISAWRNQLKMKIYIDNGPILNPKKTFAETTKYSGYQSTRATIAANCHKRIIISPWKQQEEVHIIYDECILGFDLMWKYGMILYH